MPPEPCWRRMLTPQSETPFREAIRDLDVLQEAVDRLEVYQQFQPEDVDRRAINAHLRAWPWQRGEEQ